MINGSAIPQKISFPRPLVEPDKQIVSYTAFGAAFVELATLSKFTSFCVLAVGTGGSAPIPPLVKILRNGLFGLGRASLADKLPKLPQRGREETDFFVCDRDLQDLRIEKIPLPTPPAN